MKLRPRSLSPIPVKVRRARGGRPRAAQGDGRDDGRRAREPRYPQGARRARAAPRVGATFSRAPSLCDARRAPDRSTLSLLPPGIRRCCGATARSRSAPTSSTRMCICSRPPRSTCGRRLSVSPSLSLETRALSSGARGGRERWNLGEMKRSSPFSLSRQVLDADDGASGASARVSSVRAATSSRS